MESINTQSLTFFNDNAANAYYFDISETQKNQINATSTLVKVQQPSSNQGQQTSEKRSSDQQVSAAKLEKLRVLQENVDKLEAEKESLVNQIYDLRQLLQKVNQQGEKKIQYIKTKNVNLRQQIQSLLKALEVSREQAAHFEAINSFWSSNISYCGGSYDDCCDPDSDCDCNSTRRSKNTTNTWREHSAHELSTSSSVDSHKQVVEVDMQKMSKPIICMQEQQEPEEQREERHLRDLLLQPQFKFNKGPINCVGSKSVEEGSESEDSMNGATADAAAKAALQ